MLTNIKFFLIIPLQQPTVKDKHAVQKQCYEYTNHFRINNDYFVA